jgi:hypothetical protein
MYRQREMAAALSLGRAQAAHERGPADDPIQADDTVGRNSRVHTVEM